MRLDALYSFHVRVPSFGRGRFKSVARIPPLGLLASPPPPEFRRFGNSAFLAAAIPKFLAAEIAIIHMISHASSSAHKHQSHPPGLGFILAPIFATNSPTLVMAYVFGFMVLVSAYEAAARPKAGRDEVGTDSKGDQKGRPYCLDNSFFAGAHLTVVDILLLV